MKLFFVASVLVVAGCNSADKNENDKMAGAYKMLSQSYKTSKLDTTSTTLQQLKIYTADYMMYANTNPVNSVCSFGIASYSTAKDSVIENVFYRASDSTKNDSLQNFKLLIEKTNKGYKQVIPDAVWDGEHFKLTEEYETVSTAETSSLDGAWKLVKMYTIKGRDTASTKITQFKIYGAGHFIFGHSYSDSLNKTHVGMGYGSYVMVGNNKSKETVTASNYAQIKGQVIDIDIELKGADDYKQTIIMKDGSKMIEEYQRLKK